MVIPDGHDTLLPFIPPPVCYYHIIILLLLYINVYLYKVYVLFVRALDSVALVLPAHLVHRCCSVGGVLVALFVVA